MSAVFKIAAVAIFCTLAALTVKKTNGEMALILECAACIWALFALMKLLTPMLETVAEMKRLAGLSDAVISPVLKCTAIGIVSRITADICRDGGQAALCSAVETAGVVCAVCAAMPLVSMLLSVVEDLL